MENKQIIIDGVDVSGCDYFNFTDEHYCDECSSEFGCAVCDERTICYYKQLKRKEQENKRLLEIINAKPLETVDIDSAFEIEKLKEQLKRKEQECEELKKIINEAKNSNLDLKSFLVGEAVQNEYEQQLDQLKAENEELKEEIKHYKQIAQYHGNLSVKYTNKSAKLKQTLAEIKVICNNNDELQGDFNVVDCDKYKLGKHNLANKVLQKIKEYRVEE